MSRKRSHCKELPKSISASVVGLNMGTNNQKKDPKLVGETNEVSITIGDTDTTALLDSGSCISAISYSYWKENLANNYPLQPLQDIINLKIECADGQKLPYLGYIETELKISHGLPKASPLHCLFLITPDTNYSSRTPVIIGTNILSELLQECKQNFGPQFIQKAGLHTPWFLAFRCITYREKELKRNKNKVAIVRCAEPTRIILGPNESRDILGETDKELEYGQTTAIIHETEDSVLPDFIDITPGIVNYDKEKNRQLIITVSNLTTNSVVISPRSILCELQPVKIEDKIVNEPEDNSFHDVIGKVTIDTSNYLTEDQHLQIKALLLKHIDIFSKNDTDIGHCTKVKHRIDLVDDIPFKQRHRRIPPHMIEEVRNHLENLLSAGIIQKSKSPWASNIVLVRKKNGSLRVCIDYRQLNSKSVKDSYSLPRIEEVFDVLHGSKYFSTLDMKSGYHQVEVEETHRERTAFTAGPLGFFEYVKMPFGLANSPATYQRLMEECLGDYNMTICVIYLDDLIIFADTFEEHLDRLDKVLTRLKECELKLSPEKCFFIQEKVKFLGHVTSDSEESDSGDEYVSYTYKRGDAHKPGNEKMIDSIEESISDDQGTVNEMEDAEIEDSGEIKAFESEHGSHTDNLEVHDSATGADTSVKRIGRGVRLKVIETDSKDKSTETKVTKDDEKRKMEGTLRKEPEKMKRVTLSRRTEETKSSEREPTEQSEKRPKPAPRDPVRKSERSKKLPVRYQDYEMNLMVPKPPDYRLHALDVFINSGVFNYVDPEVAKKVINAVMQ